MPKRHLTAALFAVVLGSLIAGSAQAYQREVQTAADSIGEKLAASGKRSIAVVDFTDLQGNVTELGRFLAEELSVALASGPRAFEVIDRTHLKALLQEHKLSATGLIDPATAKKLGQIAGVDALVTGSLTPFGDTVRLTLKVLDTSSARIVAASTAEIAKTKVIGELVERGIGASAPTSQPVTSRGTPPPAAAMPEPVENAGLRFTLRRCSKSGSEVRCGLLIENLTESTSQIFSISSESFLYDSSGNQYGGAEVSLGTSASSERSIRQNLIPGIPLAAQIVFSGVPSATKEVSLSMSFRKLGGSPSSRISDYAGGSQFSVVFRSVPLG